METDGQIRWGAFAAQFRHESRFVLPLMLRELPKRIAVLGVIVVITIAGGVTEGLVAMLLACLLAEGALMAVAVVARRPGAGETRLVLGGLWLVCGFVTFSYMGPAILLSYQPSVPLLLTGYTWTFGLLVHMANVFGRLPLFNICQLIPALVTMTYAFQNAAQTGYFAGSNAEWMIAGAGLLVYCANTIQTTFRQREILVALAQARTDADDHMRRLEQTARRDTLTGLMNRTAFDAGLAQMLQRATAGAPTGVFLIDLDGFKPVNDTYGHAAGDAILAAVADRLRAIAGDSGLTARLGGDEFALAMPGLHSSGAAMQIAQIAVHDIGQPVRWMDKRLSISASVGVALTGLGATTVSDLCAAADQAMFRAKGSSLRTMMYLPGAFPRRLTPNDRQRLVEALSSGAISLHYQPKVRLSDSHLIGLEGLARWDTADRGLLLPDDFLPQINQMGLQGDFAAAMTGRVLADIDGMLGVGLDPGQVSVNLSESTLATQAGLAALQDLLARHPRAVPHLTLEVTDTIFTTRGADIIRQSLSELRACGLRVSLDDFGAGFAGFRRLRPLPLDEVKIAPDFVADLGHDAAAAVLVRGAIDIARGLNLQVIAEGVETEAQRDLLISLGARNGQGFLFGAAMPLAETQIHLAAEATRPRPDAFVPGLAVPRPGSQTISGKAR